MSTATSWITSQVQIIQNLSLVVAPVEKLITGAAYLIGLAFIFKAVFSLKSYGEAKTMSSSNHSIKEPLAYFVAGTMLLYFPTALSTLLLSTFGESNVMAYGPINGSSDSLNSLFGSGSAVGEPLCMLIQVIGMVAFVRGWILIARSASTGQPPGGTGKGMMHVFGGILAINIVGTITMLNNTLFGGS
ncbi:MAG: type IV secretion protein IcmC [Legionellales bacterium]